MHLDLSEGAVFRPFRIITCNLLYRCWGEGELLLREPRAAKKLQRARLWHLWQPVLSPGAGSAAGVRGGDRDSPLWLWGMLGCSEGEDRHEQPLCVQLAGYGKAAWATSHEGLCFLTLVIFFLKYSRSSVCTSARTFILWADIHRYKH